MNVPETAYERAALVAWLLARGKRLRTRQIALLIGLNPRNTYRLLCRISRVIEIYQDEAGYWCSVYAT